MAQNQREFGSDIYAVLCKKIQNDTALPAHMKERSPWHRPPPFVPQALA